jgi:hypothetical protein
MSKRKGKTAALVQQKGNNLPAEVVPAPVETGETVSPSEKASLQRLRKKLEERPAPVRFTKDPNDPEGKGVVIQDADSMATYAQMFETTGTSDLSTGGRLITQAYRSQAESVAKWSTVAHLMHEIAPQDGLEGMLAAQMVAAHNMAMEFTRRAMLKDQTMDSVDRNINRATKMMSVFTRQTEALQKLRTKGQQRITVQHVQVNQGGQAVIGDINPGGGGRG